MENREVTEETIFCYFQEKNLFWAEYSGGDVLKGHMIGTVAGNGELDFHYQHMNWRTAFGACFCRGRKDGMFTNEYWGCGGKCETAEMV